MPLATMSDAVAEYARNAGMDDPARAWILSPYDTWHANPFYRGTAAVPHPEDDSECYEVVPCLRGPAGLEWCECRSADDLPF